jgi:hypothetical protein
MPIELLDISIGNKKRKKPAKEPFKPKNEEGSIQVRLSNGAWFRQKQTPCLTCGNPRVDLPFGTEANRATMAGICLKCFRAEQAARDNAMSMERISRVERLASGQTGGDRRRFAMILATPIWRDREKIRKWFIKRHIG